MAWSFLMSADAFGENSGKYKILLDVTPSAVTSPKVFIDSL